MNKILFFILLIINFNYIAAEQFNKVSYVATAGEQPSTKSKLYPNPAASYVVIKNSSPTKIKNVSVLSMVGSVMINKEILDSNDNQEINVSKLQAGRYFVKISYSDGNQEILNMIKI